MIPTLRVLSLFRRAVLLVLVLSFAISSFAATRPNIILVTLGSTRADRMGYLGAKNPTPAADALAKQGVIFEHAYAQAPTTVVSIATLLSGTYPQTHGVSDLGAPLPNGLSFLPDLLHAHGYRTAAFIGSIELDPRSGFASGFDRGFEVYDAGFRPAGSGVPILDRPGTQMVARAATWITSSAKGPFFLWVHLADPATARGVGYDRAVAVADAAVGKLISALRAQKLFDDSLIILAADHGESLGAHGEATHGVFLYDDAIRVPLLLKLPQNQMAGKRVRGRARLLDAAPTILEVAGIPGPSQMQGQSLLRMARTNPDADQPAYSRADFSQQAFGWSPLESWRSGKYLYIRAPQPELYDLSADPGANHNLAGTSKAVLETLASQLTSFTSRLGNPGTSSNAGLTSSEVQKLASLGYVGVQKPATAASSTVAGTDPKDGIATANRVLAAWASVEQGHPEKAIPTLRELAKSQPGAYLAQYALGVALAQQGKEAEAVPFLHKAIEIHPDSAWAQYWMGLSLLKTGDNKTAVVHLEIAATRLPEFAPAQAALQQARERIGRLQSR